MASLYQAPYFSDSLGGCCPLWRDPNLLQPRGENNTINHTINHHQKKTINHHPHFFFEKLAPSPNGLLFQFLNLNGWKQCPRPLQFDLIIFWKTQSQLSSSIIRRKKTNWASAGASAPGLVVWCYFELFSNFRSEACFHVLCFQIRGMFNMKLFIDTDADSRLSKRVLKVTFIHILRRTPLHHSDSKLCVKKYNQL